MAMNILDSYSQFYKEAQTLKTYGSGEGLIPSKDTLVKYEFNTTDQNGNKIMDPMTKEEVLQMMKDVQSQYGDNVLLEFSGDGMAALAEDLKAQSRKRSLELTEEEKAIQAEKQAEFEKVIVHLEDTRRLIIPNIQTNEALYGSLENAGENVVRAATDIIRNCLMPWNVAGMTEQQRKEMIAFGMEEAKYLAVNYFNEEQGKHFLSAMETIAKYGMNGIVAEDGRVTYQIERGPLVGAPDDYVNSNEILKDKAPELYQKLRELNQKIINGESGWGSRFIALQKQIEQVLQGNSNTYTDQSGKPLTNYEEAVAHYKNWKEKMVQTELPEVFENVQYQDAQSFFTSLQGQGSLPDWWIKNSVEQFRKRMTA